MRYQKVTSQSLKKKDRAQCEREWTSRGGKSLKREIYQNTERDEDDMKKCLFKILLAFNIDFLILGKTGEPNFTFGEHKQS